MRCIEVESEHENPGKKELSLFGRDFSYEDLLLFGLVFLLLSQRKGKEKGAISSSLPKLDTVKNLLGKMADSELLILMLIYMLL